MHDVYCEREGSRYSTYAHNEVRVGSARIPMHYHGYDLMFPMTRRMEQYLGLA